MTVSVNVKRLPKDPGPAAWNSILPTAEPYATLEDEIAAEWLIIGAGFAGLAAARRLSQLHPGDRIVVLEARRVAEGPAGRNSGFMIDLPHDLASDAYGGGLERDLRQTRFNRAAIDFAFEAAKDYAMSAEAIDLSGKINGAATDKGLAHNTNYAKHLSTMGEACDLIDADGMRAITGSSYYRGGLFTARAAMIQPALFVRNFAAGLAANRVSIFENSPVVALENNAGGWTARTPKGSVEAPRTILAVNGHAESFGFFERQLMHVFTYASMTRALSREEVTRLGGRPIWGLTPADPMGTTVRRISGTGGDRIVIRNRFTFDPTMEIDDRKLARITRDHDRAFRERFPMLSSVAMEYRWGGRLCLSWNGVPAFGELAPGLYSACCQNGLGTTRGTLAGMLAAELASGLTTDLLAEMLAEAPPHRLPPSPIATLGARATIKWNELKAGREL